MDAVSKTYDVGVVVARFQVSEPHDGHIELLDTVCANHAKTVLLLGCSPIPNSETDPLDFQAREWMIRECYPHLLILPLYDVPDDAQWSARVDNLVRGVLGPNQTAVLYGSRDSFLPYYVGGYPTIELVATSDFSGTEHRTEIGRAIRSSADWRAGVIWASQQHFPTCYSTVDVAVFNQDFDHVLMGKKPGETQWRFPGGFSDPLSASFEDDARREVKEETDMDTTTLTYLGSFIIDDWRYRKGPNCIKTLLFTGVGTGTPQAGDDLAEVGWVSIHDLEPTAQGTIMRGHLKLATKVWSHWYHNIRPLVRS